MTQYYFLGTYLPELQLGLVPDISVESFLELLKENLSEVDQQKLLAMQRYYDLENICSYRNFDGNRFEEIHFAPYVQEFMDTYESYEERIRNFPLVFAAYFENEIKSSEGFLKTFLIEERSMRQILTALRAKKFKRSFLTEFQFEDAEDDLVAYILAQKDAKSFDPPEEFAELKVLFENFSDHPLELHQALATYRFEKVKEWIGLQVFSIDRLLAYYFQLVLADQWVRLDQEKGQKIMNTILQDT